MNYQAAVNISAQFTGKQATDQATSALDNIANSALSTNQGLQGVIGAAKGLAAAFAIKEITSAAKYVLDLGDSLFLLQQKTGIGVQALSGLRTAAELSGVGFDQLQVGLRKFSQNAVDAFNGVPKAKTAFDALGISVKDSNGQLKPAGELIDEVADKFAVMKDGPIKAADAIRLFGKSGTDMIPLLNQGSEALTKFGLSISDDFAARAHQFNQSLVLIGNQGKQAGIDMASGLLPTLQEIANAFLDLSKGGADSIGVLTAVAEVTRQLAVIVGVVVESVAELVDSGITGLKELGATIYLVGKELADMGHLVESAKSFLTGNLDAAEESLSSYSKAASADIQKYFSDTETIGDKYIDRLKSRSKATVDFVKNLEKNSSLVGNGAAGSEADTKPPAAHSSSFDPDASSLDAAAAKRYQDAIKATEERINKLKAEAVQENESNAQKQVSIELAELENRGITKNTAAYSGLAKALTEAVNAEVTAKEKQQAGDYLAKQTDEYNLSKLQLEQYDMSAAEFDKLTYAKRQAIDVDNTTKHMTEEGAQAYRDAADAVKQLHDNLIDEQQAQKESFGQGAKEAWHDYLEAAKDTAAQTKHLFSNVFSGMEDAIVAFVKTGKLSFASLADAIEDDLIRIAIRQAIVFGASAAFGGGLSAGSGTATAGSSYSGTVYSANGNVVGPDGIMNLKKYALGGIASSPQVSVFGEGSTPEAYVPLPDGRTIPVTLSASSDSSKSSQGGVNIEVNVVLGSDGSDQTTANSDAGQSGKQLGIAISAAVKTEILNQKRPGGLLA